MNLTVKSRSDLEHLLSTVRYWILNSFPSELIAYLLNLRNPEVEEVLTEYQLAFPHINNFVGEYRSSRGKHACTLAAKHGCLDFLDYLLNRRKRLNIHVLQSSAIHGQVDCLSFCHQFLSKAGKNIDFAQIDWSEVVQRGHLACLKYFIQERMVIDVKKEGWCWAAAKSGQLECLKYLLSVCRDRRSSITEAAALQNHLPCLQCAVEQGCGVSKRTWKAAITVKITNCLQYLLDSVPIPKDSLSLGIAAIRSHNRGALRILHQRGLLVESECIVAAAEKGDLKCLQFLYDKLHFDCRVPSTMVAAVKADQLKLVRKLDALSCPWDESAAIAALEADHSNCFEYLINQRGIPTSDAFCSIQPGLMCRLVLLEHQFDQIEDAVSWLKKRPRYA